MDSLFKTSPPCTQLEAEGDDASSWLLFLFTVQNQLRQTQRQTDGDKHVRLEVKEAVLEKCTSHLGHSRASHPRLELRPRPRQRQSWTTAGLSIGCVTQDKLFWKIGPAKVRPSSSSSFSRSHNGMTCPPSLGDGECRARKGGSCFPPKLQKGRNFLFIVMSQDRTLGGGGELCLLRTCSFHSDQCFPAAYCVLALG